MRFPPAKKYFRDPRQRLLEESMRPVFSGDLAHPYRDMPPPTLPAMGVGYGDFDYGGAGELVGPLAGLHLHTQLSQSTQSGISATHSVSISTNLASGPVTQQSQRSQASQPGF